MNAFNFIKELMIEIIRDVASLYYNEGLKYVMELQRDKEEIEKRIQSIIESIEDDNDEEFDGEAEQYIDFYLNVLTYDFD